MWADQRDHGRNSPLPAIADNLEITDFRCQKDRASNFLYHRSIVCGLTRRLVAFIGATADVGFPAISACIASVVRLVVLLAIDPQDLMCKQIFNIL